MVRLWSEWLDRSCLLAKWLREKVWVRVRVRAGDALLWFLFFFLLTNVVKILSLLVG